ncbi:unnamed protein product [Prorocentrum cordatum]|uniref:UBA domain-containing protein n=1 Tax=Prorocentrum cordatum TaxID=2364126 RepID=A0ABN9UL56_9DINO|nr:unnamed protein product [Polarella glacialis]
MTPALAANSRTAASRTAREGGGWAAVAGRGAPAPPAARGWAELPEGEKRSRTSRLMEMGFPQEDDARQALEEHSWDPNRALDSLILGACRPKPGAQGGAGAAVPPRAPAGGTKAAAEAGIKSLLGLQPKPPPGGGASPDRSTAASDTGHLVPAHAAAAGRGAAGRSGGPPGGRDAQPAARSGAPGLEAGEDWCSASQLNVEEGDPVLVWDGSGTAMGWIYAESVKEGGGAGWLPLSAVGEGAPQQPPLPPAAPALEQLAAAPYAVPLPQSAPAPEQPAMVPYAAPVAPGQLAMASYAAPVPPPPVQAQSSARWMRTSQACAATYDNQLPVQAGAPLLVHTDRVSPDGHWVFAEAQDAGARSFPGVGVGPAAASRSGWVPRVCVEWPGSR